MTTVPMNEPLVIAGDFNDWRHKANRALVDELEVVEVFEAVKGRAARTFPSVMPVFRLDRIYARGLEGGRGARALRVPGGEDLRPRGAGRDVRACPRSAGSGARDDEPVHARATRSSS